MTREMDGLKNELQAKAHYEELCSAAEAQLERMQAQLNERESARSDLERNWLPQPGC
jgi:hypothetical protein